MALGLALAAAAPAAAEPPSGTDEVFGAMLILSDRPEEFLEAWDRPAAPGYRPVVRRVARVRPGDEITALVLFVRCQPDPAGRCDARVDFTVLAPDGSPWARHPDQGLWDAPPPRGGNLQLGQARLAFRIGPGDPLGEWAVEAQLRDRVSGRDLVLREALQVAVDPVPR